MIPFAECGGSEMKWRGLARGLDFDLESDQAAVISEYFRKNGRGRVCVSAGAGTGKTTLLIEIFVEATIRLYNGVKDKKERTNPFDRILAVTFTVEAARQMKQRVRRRMISHFNEINDPDSLDDILRWLENDSWILTLDSLTRRLLSEVSPDAGLSPLIDVPDEFELQRVQDQIMDEIQDDPNLQEQIRLLETAFPNQEWRGLEGWSGMVREAFSRARMYCLSSSELLDNARDSFGAELYRGFQPPFSRSDVREICERIGGVIASPPSRDRMQSSYGHNESLMEAFFEVLQEYERLYDLATKARGWLGHDDARYWLEKYIECEVETSERSSIWRDGQLSRFDHVLVDEFQDTSYSQCVVLKHFIGSKTRVLLIGDPKQAIFQWRNAEPEIFVRILDRVPLGGSGKKVSERIPFLEADGFVQYELTSNFRSHGALIGMFNQLFGSGDESIFSDAFYTIGFDIPHSDLEKKVATPVNDEEVNQEYIHPMSGDDWIVIPQVLRLLKSGQLALFVREQTDKDTWKWRKARPGDFCILMQSRGRWPALRRELIENDIDYVMLADRGLFQRPEVKLLVDVLDWLANPHNKDSLSRILRSPIVGLDDRALRAIAINGFDLNLVLGDDRVCSLDWFKREAMPLIQGLVSLRDDLRWTREGKKSSMIEKILRFSHLDSVLLSDVEGNQRLANIWAVQDIVSQWEEEELLSYDEFVDRIKYFREFGEDAYNQAVLADDEEKESVRVATVHASKGLEFPIVFVYYPKLDFVSQWRYTYGQMNIMVRKQGKFFLLRQAPPPGESGGVWESYLAPSRALKGPTDNWESPYLFEPFILDYWAEKWRLYYVAVTRARDHVFHSSDSARNSYMWQSVFREWYKNHRNDENLGDKISVDDLPPLPDIPEKLEGLVEFDDNGFRTMRTKGLEFSPRTLSPSHIHDMMFCPRKYQYAVLQEVLGGPHCQFGTTEYERIRFGTHVHNALELRDFRSRSPNRSFLNYINLIRTSHPVEAKAVQTAVEAFLTSELYEDLSLGSAEHRKELQILCSLRGDDGVDVLMRDKADLVVETHPGAFVVVDYKTYYPEGDDAESKFTHDHYAMQLRSYALALERSLESQVIEAFVAAYDSTDRKWRKHSFEPLDAQELADDILSRLPLKVVEGGLEKRPKDDYCDDHCEFSGICGRS